jgi:hypothetical protein
MCVSCCTLTRPEPFFPFGFGKLEAIFLRGIFRKHIFFPDGRHVLATIKGKTVRLHVHDARALALTRRVVET